MNAKKREEKLMEDEALMKTLVTARGLLEQGYEDKVRRMLSKHEVMVKNLKEFDQLMEKVSGRIDKAKNPKKKEVEPGTKDEPEVKRRRQDMDEDEKRDFDIYLQEIKIKRQELLEKRSARHFRKQQLAKRRTAASQERMR